MVLAFVFFVLFVCGFGGYCGFGVGRVLLVYGWFCCLCFDFGFW